MDWNTHETWGQASDKQNGTRSWIFSYNFKFGHNGEMEKLKIQPNS